MSKTPNDRRYTRSHEWVLIGANGVAVVGISDYAQEALGDLVFAETPEVGRKVAAGEVCAVLESVKAASDVYAPVAGEVVEVNELLRDQPELMNRDPYGDGWLWKMKPHDIAEVDTLLDADAYASSIEHAR